MYIVVYKKAVFILYNYLVELNPIFNPSSSVNMNFYVAGKK